MFGITSGTLTHRETRVLPLLSIFYSLPKRSLKIIRSVIDVRKKMIFVAVIGISVCVESECCISRGVELDTTKVCSAHHNHQHTAIIEPLGPETLLSVYFRQMGA